MCVWVWVCVFCVSICNYSYICLWIVSRVHTVSFFKTYFDRAFFFEDFQISFTHYFHSDSNYELFPFICLPCILYQCVLTYALTWTHVNLSQDTLIRISSMKGLSFTALVYKHSNEPRQFSTADSWTNSSSLMNYYHYRYRTKGYSNLISYLVASAQTLSSFLPTHLKTTDFPRLAVTSQPLDLVYCTVHEGKL